MLILKVMLFPVIGVSCILFYYYLRKERIVSGKLKEAYTALDEAAVKREREAKRSILIGKKGNVPQKGLGKYIKGAEKLYRYSGLGRKFKGLTFEIWTVVVLAVCAAIYFPVLVITKDMYKAFMFVVLYIILIVGMEKILALYHYRRVDENLLNFLNMLSNFNATDGDIISIFSKVSRYLPDPLQTVLEECCYEAQISGDKRLALYALAEKIENPGFKNVIYDIEICVNYSANFAEVINKSRRLIRDEQKAQKDRKALANDLSFTMLLMSVLIVVAISIADGLLTNGSIWSILIYTTFGKGCMTVVAGIYIFFYYKLAALGK